MTAKINGIYAITNDTRFDFKQITQIINKYNIKILQYRRNHNSKELKIIESHKLQQFCKKNNILFIINNDIMLAKTIYADGVHLGKNDTDINAARAILGTDAIIGISCYNQINLAINAEKNGANYCAFGSIFNSTTKTNAPRCKLDIIKQAKNKINIPIVAIGGINFNNINKVLATKCDAVAMVSALW